MNKKKLYSASILGAIINLYAQPTSISIEQLEKKMHYTFNNKTLLETAISENSAPNRQVLIENGNQLLDATIGFFLHRRLQPTTETMHTWLEKCKIALCTMQQLYYLARYFELTPSTSMMKEQSNAADSIKALIGALQEDSKNIQPDAYEIFIYNFFMSMLPNANLSLFNLRLILPTTQRYQPTAYLPMPRTIQDFFDGIIHQMNRLTKIDSKPVITESGTNNRYSKTLRWRKHVITLTEQDSYPSYENLIRELLLTRQKTFLAGAQLTLENADNMLINPLYFLYTDMLHAIDRSQLSQAKEDYVSLCTSLYQSYLLLGEPIIESRPPAPLKSTPDLEESIRKTIDAMDFYYHEKIFPD